MHTQAPTYSPLVPPRDIPRRIVGCDGYGCPHTSGVRYYYPCGPFATEPCRPTACTRITAEPAPNVHCSLYIVHCWFYTFSAKEKDVETGLSYFGSRYYSSNLSLWLSVDPMSDKYASLSPYVYCADNPVKLVDPNGEEILEDKPPGKIAQFLSNLESKIEGSADNRQLEGHSDGANRGTVTDRDVAVGVATVTAIVTVGAGLEAEGAVSYIITGLSVANDIDDATVDSNGQTFFQRVTADNPVANKSVDFLKSASSGASALSSTKTVEKKGIQKSPYSLVDAVKSTYNYVKSFFSKNRNNGQS